MRSSNEEQNHLVVPGCIPGQKLSLVAKAIVKYESSGLLRQTPFNRRSLRCLAVTRSYVQLADEKRLEGETHGAEHRRAFPSESLPELPCGNAPKRRSKSRNY
jgi:hypothetical protein